MANIVIMVGGVAVSHVLQTMRLANDLKARGHKITYSGLKKEVARIVEPRGFSFYHLDLYAGCSPSVAEVEVGLPCSQLPIIARTSNLLTAVRQARHEAQNKLAAISRGSCHRQMLDALAPTLLIVERTLVGSALPFRAWGVPIIMISPTLPWERSKNVPPMSSHFVPSCSALSRVRCAVEWWRRKLRLSLLLALTALVVPDVDRTTGHLRKLAKHYGVRFKKTFDTRRMPVGFQLPELILCPASFDFPRSPLVDRYFVDSGVDVERYQANELEEALLRWIRPETPLVYCSFGTRLPIRPKPQEVLHKIVDALIHRTAFQMVICAPDASLFAEYTARHERIRVVDKWISQVRVLEHAAVHITHGGFSSVRESIECEVPMVVIPFDADQPGNAARVVYHGLGTRLLPKCFDGELLVCQVLEVLECSSYRKRIREMKASFHRQRSIQSAASVVEQFRSLTESASWSPTLPPMLERPC